MEVKPFVLNPDNDRWQGDVVKTYKLFARGETYWRLARAIAALIAGIGLAYFTYTNWSNYSALDERGLETNARITGIDIPTNGRFDPDAAFILEYSYEVERETYTVRIPISSATYSTVDRNARFEVVYLPENPSVSKLVGSTVVSPFERLETYVALFSIGFGLYTITDYIGKMRKEKKLRQNGTLVTGYVVQSTERSGFKLFAPRRLEVIYGFTSPKSQKELRGVQRSPPNVHPKNHVVPTNTQVRVIYFDDKTFALL